MKADVAWNIECSVSEFCNNCSSSKCTAKLQNVVCFIKHLESVAAAAQYLGGSPPTGDGQEAGNLPPTRKMEGKAAITTITHGVSLPLEADEDDPG